MSRSGIVNVRMVITEEKIISNIDKIQKLINPNNKKQIIQLEEDTYFKDLIESVKTYLVEYPKKKNFPTSVYNAAYGLVEYAISRFEENTKKVEELIKKRENNIALSENLKELIEAVDNKEEGWKEQIETNEYGFDDDTIEALSTIGRCRGKTSKKYQETMKILKAKVNNLETNLHIEIDMERLEDSSKALSFIGIEISDALKLIPTPEEMQEKVVEEQIQETPQIEKVEKTEKTQKKAAIIKKKKVKAPVQTIEEKETEKEQNSSVEKIQEKEDKTETVTPIIDETENDLFEEYQEATSFDTKPSLWQRFKNSKIVRAATLIFRIRIRIEIPTNALPEGRGENN